MRSKTTPRKARQKARNLVFPDATWELAQERAKSANRSVSNYLQTLVLRDAGMFQVTEEAAVNAK